MSEGLLPSNSIRDVQLDEVALGSSDCIINFVIFFNHYRLDVQLPVNWKESRLRSAWRRIGAAGYFKENAGSLPTFAPNKILLIGWNVSTTTSLRWRGRSLTTNYSLWPIPVENSFARRNSHYQIKWRMGVGGPATLRQGAGVDE